MSLASRLTALATRIGQEIRAVRVVAEAEASTATAGRVKLDPTLSGLVNTAGEYYSYTTLTTSGAPGEVPSVPAVALYAASIEQLNNDRNAWTGASTPGEVTNPIKRVALEASARTTLDKADTAVQNLTDRGAWATSIAYAKGDIVTSQYARWYCKTAHNSGGAWAETNWIHLGLYAVGATADPGVSGRLWVDVS